MGTNTSSNDTLEEGLDERWDTNLGYYHPSNPNKQQKERPSEVLVQQNLDANQSLIVSGGPLLLSSIQVSPPFSVKSNGSINNTTYFRQGLGDHINSPVIHVATVPTPSTTPLCAEKQQDVDYLTTDDALNDVPPNECIAISPNQQKSQDAQTETPTPPASLSDYHSALVRYYIDTLLHKTDPHTISPHVIKLIESTLPPKYQGYILSLRKTYSVPYPSL